jgi:hypothetical protein
MTQWDVPILSRKLVKQLLFRYKIQRKIVQQEFQISKPVLQEGYKFHKSLRVPK